MNVNRNLQCVYSAPRPLGISPLEPPVPPICVGHETRIASFNLRVVRCTCGAAMEFFIIYRSLFPIQWVVVPWMLDERYTFPPEFESLQHQIVKKNDQCFRGQMLEHHCKIYINQVCCFDIGVNNFAGMALGDNPIFEMLCHRDILIPMYFC